MEDNQQRNMKRILRRRMQIYTILFKIAEFLFCLTAFLFSMAYCDWDFYCAHVFLNLTLLFAMIWLIVDLFVYFTGKLKKYRKIYLKKDIIFSSLMALAICASTLSKTRRPSRWKAVVYFAGMFGSYADNNTFSLFLLSYFALFIFELHVIIKVIVYRDFKSRRVS